MTADQPGVARAISGRGPGRTFEYDESGRSFRVEWDPRETGTFLPVMTSGWGGDRDRLHDALWDVARGAGVTALLEEVAGSRLFVPLRWDRPRGFLLNVHDRGDAGVEVDYMEPGHTAKLPALADPGDPSSLTVQVPADLRWTWPAGEPAARDARERIISRLRSAGRDDLWIGAGRAWKLGVAG
jgi:hypothetical protein